MYVYSHKCWMFSWYIRYMSVPCNNRMEGTLSQSMLLSHDILWIHRQLQMIQEVSFELGPHKGTQCVYGRYFRSVDSRSRLSCPPWRAAGLGRNHHFSCPCRSMANSTWYIVIMTTRNRISVFCAIDPRVNI